MRHKYVTYAYVLSRNPVGETGMLLTLLTEELGLIRARADGLRRPGAKLAHALQALDKALVTLVRGKEGWRLSGAVEDERIFDQLSRAARLRVARVTGLVTRLVGEGGDPAPFHIYERFLETLPSAPEETQDAAECYAALDLLSHLGLDAGPIPSPEERTTLSPNERRDIVTRINRGIHASGL